MRSRIVRLFVALAVIVSTVTTASFNSASAQELPACSSLASLPAGVTIEPPGEGLDARLVAFAGVWEGSWDGTSPSIMAVTRVGPADASIVYVLAGDTRIARRPATLAPEGVMEWRYSDAPNAGRYRFTLAEDGATLAGTWDFGGQVREISMTRCSPNAPPRPAGPPAAPKPAAGPYVPPGGPPCYLQERFPPVGPQSGRRHADTFVRPGPGVPPELAAFVGAWHGVDESGVEVRVVVVTASMSMTRAWLAAGDFDSEGFWTLEMPGSRELRTPMTRGNVHIFTIRDDLESVEHVRAHDTQGTRTAILTRCSLT